MLSRVGSPVLLDGSAVMELPDSVVVAPSGDSFVSFRAVVVSTGIVAFEVRLLFHAGIVAVSMSCISLSRARVRTH